MPLLFESRRMSSMPKIDPELKARAVRLVSENPGEYPDVDGRVAGGREAAGCREGVGAALGAPGRDRYRRPGRDHDRGVRRDPPVERGEPPVALGRGDLEGAGDFLRVSSTGQGCDRGLRPRASGAWWSAMGCGADLRCAVRAWCPDRPVDLLRVERQAAHQRQRRDEALLADPTRLHREPQRLWARGRCGYSSTGKVSRWPAAPSSG